MRMTADILVRAETEFSAKVIIEISSMLGRRRMSQAALARALDVKPMWVSDRLTGRVRLTVDDLDRIADSLQCGIVDLLPRDHRDGRPTDREDRDLAVAPAGYNHVDHPIITLFPQPVIPQPRGRMRPAPTGR